MTPEKQVEPAPLVPPFVRYVASAIPMVFDDSLSYYECLAALTKYLQDVVDVINNNGTVTEEYIQLTKDMKEYMDNYFENLDVQEEINNKLDAMVEAGTLQEIIGEYLNATAVWGFDSVADMKNAENLIAGSYAQTFGRDALNDGGNALYKIREITNEDVVDETHIIAIGTGTLIAELINPNIINPDTFDGDNDTEKVQNAITYAVSLYEQNIPVAIRLNRVFEITSSLYIEISVKRLPFIFTSSTAGGFKKTTSGYLFNTTQTYVSDITFDGITFISENQSGLIIMESPKFINVKFDKCTFKNVDKAIYSSTYLQAFTFSNCLITGGESHFIEFCGSYYLNVDNCTVEHRKNSYFIYQNYQNITYRKQFFTNVTNCLVEGFTGSTSGFMHITSYEQINITNNYFEKLFYVIVHDAKDWGGELNIKNNRFHQSTDVATYNTSGMLRLEPYESTHFKMGKINFEGNRVNSTYAVYINDSSLGAVSGYSNKFILNYKDNEVSSTLSSSFSVDGDTSYNAPFNILPMFKLTSGTSVYDRSAFWKISNTITWHETIEVSDVSYTPYYKFEDGILYVSMSYTASVAPTNTYINLYLGIDPNVDDIYSVTPNASGCQLLFYLRQGSAGSKYLTLQAKSTSDQTVSKGFNTTVMIIGHRG